MSFHFVGSQVKFRKDAAILKELDVLSRLISLSGFFLLAEHCLAEVGTVMGCGAMIATVSATNMSTTIIGIVVTIRRLTLPNIVELPVSQRIWTPRSISASGFQMR